MDFPPEHWRGIHATNVLEWLNRELARRCDVVGIFPNGAAVLRLLGTLLEEQQDEWLVQRRYFSQVSVAKLKGGDAAGSDLVSALATTAVYPMEPEGKPLLHHCDMCTRCGAVRKWRASASTEAPAMSMNSACAGRRPCRPEPVFIGRCSSCAPSFNASILHLLAGLADCTS